MLSEQARKLIFDNKKAYEERLKNPFQGEPPTIEQVRKFDYDNSVALSHLYANTIVTTENFNGTPVDVMIPKEIKRKEVYFYIHGGAWAFGSAMNARLTACYFTEDIGAVALCPDYRLAPEHKYSVLLRDCYQAFSFACARYGAENIILCGSSAGGNLSLALMQLLKEKGEAYPKALILYSPVSEINPEKDTSALKNADIILRDYNDGLIATYGDTPNDYKGKFMSPINGEYDGFPPMYICCGSEEILFDDSVKLFKKAKKAGVKAVLSVRAGMWHSYPECHHFIPEGKMEIASAISFIDDVMGELTV